MLRSLRCWISLATALIAFVGDLPSTVQGQESQQSDQRLQFFEARIRPMLIEKCQPCHAADSDQEGGLLLDSKLGWSKGGDHGPAIVPGRAAESLAFKAVTYSDPKLQMPPDGKLPADVIEDFKRWINDGAKDPREQIEVAPKRSRGMEVSDAQNHWAYRQIDKQQIAEVEAKFAPGTSIDQWINKKLLDTGIQPARPASPEQQVRRLYYDLIGLPPTGQELKQWTTHFDDAQYAQLVEYLLNSPRYGEAMARRWMDVVRYADSVTLRGLIYQNSWRYRDYLIASFNHDLSYSEFIHEQIAGDMMDSERPEVRARQLIATTFLTLGNTNLEKQDKQQLDMDYLDEQLEVIGAAFLGQTLGCARCHDHKFDPIPTRDYYALAGILKSSTGLKHANVSEWIDKPLPLEKSQEESMERLERKQKQLADQIKQLKKSPEPNSKQKQHVPPDRLPGVIVDSSQANLVGPWIESTHVSPIVGQSYLHDDNKDKGQKSATFEPPKLAAGEYEVLLAYQTGESRATNVKVQIFSADGEHEVTVNQRKPAAELGLWQSLGRYRFEPNGLKYVLIGNADTDGHVIADAVLFLPISEIKDGSLAVTLQVAEPGSASNDKAKAANEELKMLERQNADIQTQLDARPKYMTVLEGSDARDLAIHIRGDVHSLGDVVARGFLTALPNTQSAIRSTSQSAAANPPPTRLELADWLADDNNPLTSRVYANRVWTWLMGRGIVATPNNFGTTGSKPTHPELLDSLALKLTQSNWSTKALVREIVLSQAYRRSLILPSEAAKTSDPDNTLYWRGHHRRISVEAMRDAMLLISGELELTMGGSLIRTGTKADYNYAHNSKRRSVYQPVFRNSLPELFDEFDFADTSVSIEARSRSTVAPQALALMQEPWIIARSQQASDSYAKVIERDGLVAGLESLYRACFARSPTAKEVELCQSFLRQQAVAVESDDSKQASTVGAEPAVHIDQAKLALLIQSLFASIDFRYLD